jgi:hypothetical protein
VKRVAVLIALAACGKSGEKKAADEPSADAKPKVAPIDAAPATDPACAQKAKDLEPWIAQLNVEEASFEIDFVYTLVAIDRGAANVEQQIDNVFITPTQIEAFDATESNRADTKLGEKPAQDAVVARLAAIKGMGDGTRLRVDVDGAATWGDVTRTLDAAVAAGYTEAVFAFTATSRVAQPPGVEPYTTSIEVFDAARARLDALGETCKGLGRYTTQPDDVVESLLGCNCAADPDEVRKLLWVQSRWGQARPRVGVTVALGAGTTIEQPAATPWSEAHAKLVEAAPEGAPPPAITFVAK